MGECRDLLVLWLADRDKSHVRKFPCLLKLPPTNLEWFASVFGLSLPFVYKGQCVNQQELWEVWKDKRIPVLYQSTLDESF